MYQPKLMGINEVLPKHFNDPIHKEEFEIEGFDMLPHPNVINNVGRGSILYVHKSLNCKPIDFNDLNPVFDEHVFAEINLANNNKLSFVTALRSSPVFEVATKNLLLKINTILKTFDMVGNFDSNIFLIIYIMH